MAMFEGYQFFIISGALAIPAIIMGIKEVPIKHYTLAVSIFMAILAMKDNHTAIGYLILYLFIEVIIMKSFLKIQKCKGKSKYIYYLFMILSVLPLVIYKIGGFANLSIFGFMGISYMTFKTVQIIIEIFDGLITEVDIVDTCIFLIFFPSILCGPIDRSRRFIGELNTVKSRDDYIKSLGDALLEILTGIVYKKVLGGLLLLAGTQYAYVYGLYLFFDFAGYSLMAVGMGRIYGISLPANFKAPFISVDMKDFWNRWHISLSTWFRDYLFSRILKDVMKKKWFNSDRVLQACVCMIVNMTVMGIWHGLEPHFILYGLYHGVLLALTEAYQKKSKFYKTHKKETWYKNLSMFVTFNLVMFGFYLFSGQLLA
ncbi:MAG: D-alanyl-lipoteichoic acid biosynthesis protein DltB [Eubacteriaceae bacterium]|nr:D-alanyl-lipoteichoic acid biosynthesis protein DltB [Eubacteriaceae bacterium]